ncbi:MAG: aminoglycoside phosphotransferase family protein [Dehalococcoidales bacterium]|nr:MAG: aminoglycoside phosphotransferase family protein [Dehalococcoidales bacterium]
MKNPTPELNTVKTIAAKYLKNIVSVERVSRDWSTYVFCVKTSTETFYIRFLPEDASFAAEVLVHNILLERGVVVPRVIAREHRNEAAGLSVMITGEIPGVSIENEWPSENAREILNQAGRQLALVNEVPVDGFGWIDRNSYHVLKGVQSSYKDFFNDGLTEGLNNLNKFEFSDMEITRITELVETAHKITYTENAVLVHGDFDSSHIFHDSGRYTGIIDFGEIRGCYRLTDLATCLMFDRYRRPSTYEYVLEGYQEMTPFTDDDIYGIELFVLYMTTMGMDHKKSRPRLAEFFYTNARDQLERINRIYG